MNRIAKSLLSLALAVLLLAGACLAEAAPEGVLAVINGRAVPVDEIQMEFDYYASMYEAYGLDDEIDALKDDMIEFYVQYYVQLDAAERLGLAEFTQEELDAIAQEAQEEYDAVLADYTGDFAEEGMSDEDIAAAVVMFFEENGYTLEGVEQSIRENRVMSRYHDLVTADVRVTDEDVRSAYDELVAEQKAVYDADPVSFEYDVMYGGEVYYVPEGFRTVYHILLLLEDADAELLSGLRTRRQAVQDQIAAALDADAHADTDALSAELEAIAAQIDALCAPLLERAEEIYARLDEGEPFLDLMAEYGEDPGMQAEPFMSSGYYVSADSEMWDRDFRDAAMALEKEGDVSDPVLTSYGIHLIMHGGLLESGPVPLEAVKDALLESALNEAHQNAYNAAVEAAVAEADITVYPENVIYQPDPDEAAG